MAYEKPTRKRVARTSYFMRSQSMILVPHGRMKWPARTRGPISHVTVKEGRKTAADDRTSRTRIMFGSY